MIKLKRLTLDQIEIGMVLAQEVCNVNGTCLLAAGTVVSGATIAALKRREVDYIMVAVKEIFTPEQCAVLATAARARIERLFHKVDGDPLMLKLRDTLLQYRIAQLSENSIAAAAKD